MTDGCLGRKTEPTQQAPISDENRWREQRGLDADTQRLQSPPRLEAELGRADGGHALTRHIEQVLRPGRASVIQQEVRKARACSFNEEDREVG